jgi:hypothetical protein
MHVVWTSWRDNKRREDFRSNQNNSYWWPNQRFLKFAEDYFQSWKTAIDIASWNGRYALELAKIGYQTEALEYSQAWVERIIKSASDQSLEVTAYQGDFTKDFATIWSYDLVLSSWLLEEVDTVHHQNIISWYQNATKSGWLCMIKWCIEISGRGVLVNEWWIHKEFENKEWKILEFREKKEMKSSNASIKFTNEFDAAIRTGTLVAKKID